MVNCVSEYGAAPMLAALPHASFERPGAGLEVPSVGVGVAVPGRRVKVCVGVLDLAVGVAVGALLPVACSWNTNVPPVLPYDVTRK